MKYDPDIYDRRSIRLKEYDYSQPGAYFITVCVKDKTCLFGDIVDNEMRLNDAGNMVKKWWFQTAEKYKDIELDEFVIMPNHFHGIIVINNDYHNNCRGAVSAPIVVSSIPIKPGGETPPLQKTESPKRTLGNIVAYFKYQSAKQINQISNMPGCLLWQRNYYEHIIRSENEMDRIRQYIAENPFKWAEDEENLMKIM
jgi:putative transposase